MKSTTLIKMIVLNSFKRRHFIHWWIFFNPDDPLPIISQKHQVPPWIWKLHKLPFPLTASFVVENGTFKNCLNWLNYPFDYTILDPIKRRPLYKVSVNKSCCVIAEK